MNWISPFQALKQNELKGTKSSFHPIALFLESSQNHLPATNSGDVIDKTWPQKINKMALINIWPQNLVKWPQ